MDPDHERLVARWFAGDRDAELLQRLIVAVHDDAELRAEFTDELALDRMLQELSRPALDAQPVLDAIAAPPVAGMQDHVMAQIGRVEHQHRQRRWRWLALAATLMIACLAIGGSLFGLRTAASPVRELATLHQLRELRGGDGMPAPPADGSRLRPGIIDLAAGVAEIRFDNAVRVLIEGPVRIDVVSPMLVRMLHGRLTTNVPATAHGFTVVAAGLRVVDLGTEVGIDLAHDGRADIQVYAGAIEIALDAASASRAANRVSAGTAVRVDPAVGTIHPLPFTAGRFTRVGVTQPPNLDLADIIGGGDGRGSASFDGIDPTTGILRSCPALGITSGDGAFHAVVGHPFIDGVFVPTSNPDGITLNSIGQTFPCEIAGGFAYDLIRRGGFLIRPPDGGPARPTRSPTVIDGTDYAEPGHSLIGMHANAGITFDLQAIARHDAGQVARFTALVANTAPRQLAPAACAAPHAFTNPSPTPWSDFEVRQVSAIGTTHLALQSDGSVLATAPAATDTYTIIGTVPLERISALKLEVLPDTRLPCTGPGAAANGNFVLTRLRLAISTPSGRQQITLTGAVADCSQGGWPVSAAVRGGGPDGWAIVPEIGQPHTAVFFLDPTTIPPGASIEVSLAHEQSQWTQHLIGRFRLSVTDARDPARDLAVGSGFFSVLIDGELVQRIMVPLADQTPARIDIALLPNQRFLTLMSTDGGYGNGFQWITLGDPRLELAR